MSFFSEDMASMLDVFQSETLELLEENERRLLNMAQGQPLTTEELNGFFRVAHTIKSSCAMMGLQALSESTHRLEELFSKLRDKPELAEGHNNELMDVLYAYQDFVHREMDRVAAEDYTPTSTEQLKGQIAQAQHLIVEVERPPKEQKQEAAPVPSVVPAEQELPKDGTVEHHLWRVRLKKNCQMGHVRAFLLVKQTRKLCDSLRTVPKDLEALSAEEVVRKDGLVIEFQSAKSDVVERKLMASPYVASVEDLEAPALAEPVQQPKTNKTPESSAAAEKTENHQTRYGMIPWERIVRLERLTGELITAQTMLETEVAASDQSRTLEPLAQSSRRMLSELEELVNQCALMPVASVVPQYYRIVRDIAKKEQKKAVLQIVGEELEADRSLLDAMSGPLMHLLRNAVDHGIEPPEVRTAAGKSPTGTVTLAVESLGDIMRFTVTDDGAGLDTEAIIRKAEEKGLLNRSPEQYSREELLQLVFLPGFSTTQKANQYSGRGVGMDVVQRAVEQLGGVVQLESQPGVGSSIWMEVPVSITSMECIRCLVGQYHCLLPIRSIDHIYAPGEAKPLLQTVEGQSWFRENGTLLPVLDLFTLFDEPQSSDWRLVTVHGMERGLALRVGAMEGQQTAVEKPLPELLGREYRQAWGISGCAVLGSGSLGLLLEPQHLIQIQEREGVTHHAGEAGTNEHRAIAAAPGGDAVLRSSGGNGAGSAAVTGCDPNASSAGRHAGDEQL